MPPPDAAAADAELRRAHLLPDPTASAIICAICEAEMPAEFHRFIAHLTSVKNAHHMKVAEAKRLHACASAVLRAFPAHHPLRHLYRSRATPEAPLPPLAGLRTVKARRCPAPACQRLLATLCAARHHIRALHPGLKAPLQTLRRLPEVDAQSLDRAHGKRVLFPVSAPPAADGLAAPSAGTYEGSAAAGLMQRVAGHDAAEGMPDCGGAAPPDREVSAFVSVARSREMIDGLGLGIGAAGRLVRADSGSVGEEALAAVFDTLDAYTGKARSVMQPGRAFFGLLHAIATPGAREKAEPFAFALGGPTRARYMRAAAGLIVMAIRARRGGAGIGGIAVSESLASAVDGLTALLRRSEPRERRVEALHALLKEVLLAGGRLEEGPEGLFCLRLCSVRLGGKYFYN